MSLKLLPSHARRLAAIGVPADTDAVVDALIEAHDLLVVLLAKPEENIGSPIQDPRLLGNAVRLRRDKDSEIWIPMVDLGRALRLHAPEQTRMSFALQEIVTGKVIFADMTFLPTKSLRHTSSRAIGAVNLSELARNHQGWEKDGQAAYVIPARLQQSLSQIIEEVMPYFDHADGQVLLPCSKRPLPDHLQRFSTIQTDTYGALPVPVK